MKSLSLLMLFLMPYLAFSNDVDSTNTFVFAYVFSNENILAITEVEEVKSEQTSEFHLTAIMNLNRIRLVSHIKNFYPELEIDPNKVRFQFSKNPDQFEVSREDLIADNENRLVELYQFKFEFLKTEKLQNVKIE
ncbi:MAG: hypothetical protein RIM99_05870 [Cyclobacteriaceae bacterium]